MQHQKHHRKVYLIIVLLITMLAIRFPMPTATYAGSGAELIVLDDTTPGVDVVINPVPDTTGVVAVELHNASVKITDVVGNLVFETADPSIEAIEFHFAPNAGTHTLSIERLAGATHAYLRIASLAEMNIIETDPTLVEGTSLASAQEADFPLNSDSPSSTVDFAITDPMGAITANFPGAPVTVQLVATEENRPVATLYGSLIDGIRVTMETGNYQMTLINNNTQQQTVASVSLLPPTNSDFAALVAQAETTNSTTMTNTTNPTTRVASTCKVTVTEGSVNLRSGPGTGYSVLGYGFRGDVLQVGGVNAESGWLLVGSDTISGWMSNAVGTLSGNCQNLTAYAIPYLEAAAPIVVIQQPQVPVYNDDDEDEDEDDDNNDDDGEDDHSEEDTEDEEGHDEDSDDSQDEEDHAEEDNED